MHQSMALAPSAHPDACLGLPLASRPTSARELYAFVRIQCTASTALDSFLTQNALTPCALASHADESGYADGPGYAAGPFSTEVAVERVARWRGRSL